MLTQYLLTALIVALAVAYAAWRIYDRFRHAGPCQGCALAAHCNKRQATRQARQTCDRAGQVSASKNKSQD